MQRAAGGRNVTLLVNGHAAGQRVFSGVSGDIYDADGVTFGRVWEWHFQGQLHHVQIQPFYSPHQNSNRRNADDPWQRDNNREIPNPRSRRSYRQSTATKVEDSSSSSSSVVEGPLSNNHVASALQSTNNEFVLEDSRQQQQQGHHSNYYADSGSFNLSLIHI